MHIPLALERFAQRFTNALAIDLGTANTLVYDRATGSLRSEPSVVAIDRVQRKVRAVGQEAKAMVGRTPDSISAIRPLRDGVISDFDVAEAMLHYFIRPQNGRRNWIRPRIVIAVPAGITEVERRAVREAATSAGAREVFLIEEPMAAAIGAGIPVEEPAGNLIVDIGGGTTDVAIVSLGGIAVSASARVGGDRMDDAIVQYLKRKHNLLIGQSTAEAVKLAVGSAFPSDESRKVTVRGRDLPSGMPRGLEVSEDDVLEALRGSVAEIIDTVRRVLEKSPPELASDIADRGIVLAGGGALLDGLDQLITQETGLPAFVADEPLTAVVQGCRACLEEISLLRAVSRRG